jgi:drug/metabolite transporter (DMT)-like permease
VAALLALGASLCWGVADFLGGLASRRLPVLGVLAVTFPVGALGAVVAVLVFRPDRPDGEALALAALAGLFGLAGLAALYRGLAVGAMSVVAPLSATAPLVPVVVGVARGERPGAWQWAGIALALVGIVLLSREPGGTSRVAAGATLGVVAAAGFGLFFVTLDAASDEGALWSALSLRLAGAAVVVALALVLRPRLPRTPRDAAPLVVVGLLDLSANALFAAASSRGLVSLVSVLASLYPAVVVGLAMLTLGERLTRPRAAGAVAALAGAAFISAG